MNLDEILKTMISRKLGDNFEENVMRALSDTAPQTEESLIADLAKQYRTLLACLKKAPKSVRISADDLGVIALDGETYDLDICFSHSNRKATECRAAIEALFSDLCSVTADIQSAVSQIEDQLCKR